MKNKAYWLMFMTNQPTRPPKRTSLITKGLIRPYKGKPMVSRPYQTLASGEGLGCLTTSSPFQSQGHRNTWSCLGCIGRIPRVPGPNKNGWKKMFVGFLSLDTNTASYSLLTLLRAQKNGEMSILFGRLPSLKLTACTWKLMVGRQSFPFGIASWQVLS